MRYVEPSRPVALNRLHDDDATREPFVDSHGNHPNLEPEELPRQFFSDDDGD